MVGSRGKRPMIPKAKRKWIKCRMLIPIESVLVIGSFPFSSLAHLRNPVVLHTFVIYKVIINNCDCLR